MEYVTEEMDMNIIFCSVCGAISALVECSTPMLPVRLGYIAVPIDHLP